MQGETKNETRYRLEYAMLLVLTVLFRLMPLETTTRISAALARRIAPRIGRKGHRRALENLRIAFPEKSEAERLEICLAHWENFGRIIAETMQIDRLLKKPDRFDIVSQGVLSRYRDKLGPVVGVTLHMGNWELAIWPLVESGGNPGAIYRALENPYIDRHLRKLRERLYPGGLFGRGANATEDGDDYRTARVTTDYVRQGGRLGIVCDQFFARGVPVPFFGQNASTQPLAAIIARRVGARIWMARCLRIGNESRFQIEVKELRVPRTASTSEDIRSILAGMQAQFEAWIREAPEQWMWSNRIWR